MQTRAFLEAVSSVGVFLLLAIPGYLFTKKKILQSRQVEGLSSVLVNFLWPAMVVDAMARVQADRELVRQAGQAAVWALIIIALGAACAWIWLKAGKIGGVPGGILLFAAAFANTGLIGMPLIRLLLGEEMLLLASVVELVNDVLIFTVGILLIQTGCGRPRRSAPGTGGGGHRLFPVCHGTETAGICGQGPVYGGGRHGAHGAVFSGGAAGRGGSAYPGPGREGLGSDGPASGPYPGGGAGTLAAVHRGADCGGANSAAAFGHALRELLRPVHPAVRGGLGTGHPVRDALHPVRGGDDAPVAAGDYFVNKREQFEKMKENPLQNGERHSIILS